MQTVVWLPFIETGTGTDSFTWQMAEWLSQLGAKVIPQAFPKRFEPVPFLLSRVRPPDGATSILANSWNAFAFARDGLRLVTVEHLFVLDPAYSPYKSRTQHLAHSLLVSRFLERSYRTSDVLIAPSADTARAMRSRFPQWRPIVIRHGIDTGFFTPPADRRPASGRPIRLLFLGRRTRRKGADVVRAVMEHLDQRFELLLTGDRDDFFDPARDPRIRLLGQLDRAGVCAACRQADMLLVPSRMESGPLVALEAMSCGTPVIAFKTASLPEIVENGRTGALVRLDDSRAFAEAVDGLASDPDRLDLMRRECRRIVLEKFSGLRTAERYLDVLAGRDPSTGAGDPGAL